MDQRERALKSGRMETNRRNIASASKKLNERGVVMRKADKINPIRA